MAIDRVDEAYLLLALDPAGHFPAEVQEHLDRGLAGAWLAELLVDGRIRMQAGKIQRLGHTPMDDPALDWVLERLRARRRPRPASYWIAKLGPRAGRYRELILGRLEGRGVVQRTGGRYPVRDLARREEILARMRENLSGRRDDEDVLALLAVLDGAKALDHVFGRGQGLAYHNAIEGRLQHDHRLLALARSIRHPHRWWLAMLGRDQ
ncbi:MAG TPA: GPP34 family phosphoprotein [Candidatus Thermoplasmatota archaeon]|nr:GPP34 family phosphoprotein [Candidatus Thermoplasmatota archaeon]